MTDGFGLYVILTEPKAGYDACARAVVAAGVRYLQLRMKNQPQGAVIDTARRIRAITRGTGTLFIVNDDVSAAREVDADGVHLGQQDIPLAEARRLWPEPGKLFGLSTHNLFQAAAAESAGPDYIGVGPVFRTPTKAVPDPVLGLETMSRIIRSVNLPAVAIGGINETNLQEVLARGALNFASVRPVMQTDDPEGAIRKLLRLWADHREKTV